MSASLDSGRVTIGFNDTMEAGEAARYLGCSYSHIIGLLNSKKLRGQRKDIDGRKHWLVERKDLERAKATHLVTPRPRKPKPLNVAAAPVQSNPVVENGNVKIQLEVPKEKFDLLRLAFAMTPDKTLVSMLQERIDAAYQQVKQQLAGVTL
jgi:excisionase family DNA binding protein